MSNSIACAATPSLPPHVQLIEMGSAYWTSRIVYAAAKLGLTDQLAAGARSAAELAEPLAVHGPSLHRFMRALASLGLLTEGPAGRFGLTPLGAALRTGAPGSARASVLALAGPIFTRPLDDLIYSIQTGKTAFEKIHDMPVFDYLKQHHDEASLISEFMVGFHGGEPPTVAAAYDFSKLATIVDVGGATGNMLAAILERYEGPRGILFDMPHIVTDAPNLLKARGIDRLVTIASGDFFKSVPENGDAYILSHIIHDWSEEQCLTILGNCRKAMKPDGRVLIVEMVLPAGDTPHPGKLLDMVMLTMPGGRERTEAEYGSLLAKAGFRLTRVVPTDSAVSVVEAVLS